MQQPRTVFPVGTSATARFSHKNSLIPMEEDRPVGYGATESTITIYRTFFLYRDYLRGYRVMPDWVEVTNLDESKGR